MVAKRKHCLLICPKFYGYEEFILNGLKKYFEKIDVIYENREWVSLWHRFVYVYTASIKKRVLDKFYIDTINKISTDVDTVLVIRGSSLSMTVMDYLKKIYGKSCQYIMYQWDGVKNNPEILKVVDSFDNIYTFDIEDSKKYGWGYRPLFFDSEKVKRTTKDINIAFLCSLHSQRALVLENLKSYCYEHNLSLLSNMYCNKLAYFKWKYIGKKPEYKNTNNKDVSFKSISLEEAYKIYSRSRIIVDYTHPNQTGFTMRTIEALGSRCKLVTNNQLIKIADFYNSHNIFIYEGTDIEIPIDFIDSEYEDVDEKIYQYYSLDGWITTLLGNG